MILPATNILRCLTLHEFANLHRKVPAADAELRRMWNFLQRIPAIQGPRQLSRYSDSLRAGRSGDRIPVGARFFAPVQTGPGAHPASYTTGTGSLPGVKRPGRGADHSPPSSVEVEGRVELYICSPSGRSWSVL